MICQASEKNISELLDKGRNTSRIDGGGVFLYDNSRFTMNSGSISENASESGAGVSILYGSELIMTGGTICNNTADSYGGGVYNDSTLKLSGNPKITGNTADGADDNVHIYIDKITIVNPLTSGASVGVNMNSVTGTFTTGYKTYNEGSEPSAYFSSDNDSYSVVLNDNGEAIIAIPSFGTPDFILPTGVGTIEANAFEGVTKMTVVDAQNCKKIDAEAFKGTGLKQIRLDKDCDIDEDAFSSCGTVIMYAPAGGKTEQFYNTHDGIEFVAIDSID